MIRYIFFRLFAAICITLSICSRAVKADIELLSWDDAYIKAKQLVKQMNLDQKINLSTGSGWKAGKCIGNTPALTEPKFPSLCLQDSPLGIRLSDGVTAGVAGINAAASFDKKAIYKRGEYMGKEFRGKGINIHLGPAMNFMRSPEGGRGWESSGEDPFLTGVASAETIKGIQSQGVIATAKHFILNDQELNRGQSSSDVDDRTLHEVYLWPFARSVEAGVGSIMCSYNRINGTYACENDYTLNTVLKKELGFKGFVQSDWFATHSTSSSANNGLDMSMPGNIYDGTQQKYWGDNLKKSVKSNKVKESRIDDMATRIVATWFRFRQDEDFPDVSLDSFNIHKAPDVDVQSDHYKLVRELGASSTVLLRNSGILPLQSAKKIAYIGSDGEVDPNGLNRCEDQSCDNGTLAMGWGSGTASFPYLVDPIAGLENVFGKKSTYKKHLNNWDTKGAAKAASGADVAFVFANSDSGEEYLTVDGNIGDRKNISLWNNGDNLIRAVADANNNTVVVIHSVGPVTMPWVNHPNVKAIVWPGLPGQESGNSLADIITGRVNPSARLPYTIAKKRSDYSSKPSPEKNVTYTEKLLVGYKWFDQKKIEPLFPFGYGLSYTTFEYENLNANIENTEKSLRLDVSIDVRNSGSMDGNEIVQAYLSFPASAGEPPKLLRGFEKIFVKKEGSETVSFTLGSTELSIWDTKTASWVVPSGEFLLHLGPSSRNIKKAVSFVL
ncbi:glycoside hydrolase superfamily [Sporodiniella umbellata]|nr:glycoside hydrolase superfamily [Sporodiniella umbellata]